MLRVQTWLGLSCRVAACATLCGAALLAGAILLALFAVSVQTSRAQTSSGRWINLAPMNHPRTEIAVAELDGKIYVLGGFLLGRVPTDAVEVYDPATDSWQDRAPLPFVGQHTSAASAGGRLYAIGGS